MASRNGKKDIFTVLLLAFITCVVCVYPSAYEKDHHDAMKLDPSVIRGTPNVVDKKNRDSHPLMTLWTPSEELNEVYISVPYHRQIRSYYCGPATLEMVFDFYGPDIPQLEIADVARTVLPGTSHIDMLRAAHFSNLSTSAGEAMQENVTGYTTRKLGYAAFECYDMTIDELRSLIAAGYPILVSASYHYMVAVGYDHANIIFQDPLRGEMFNITYGGFDADWDFSDHWGLFVSPWEIEVSIPHSIFLDSIFNITANITYPSPSPFPNDQYQVVLSNATLMLPEGLRFVPGETAKKIIGAGDLAAGTSAEVTWTVQAECVGNHTVRVEAEGKVAGFHPFPPSYSYEDRIGGFCQSVVAVTDQDDIPPATFDNYDGLWHNDDFYINLTATDTLSGVAETYYKINNERANSLSVDGQPQIAAESANNTLEYWSVDNADNEEVPHKILTGIKLDKIAPAIDTPSRIPQSNIQPDQEVKVLVNATDSLSLMRNVTLSYNLNDNLAWTTLPMTLNSTTGLYEAIVPEQQIDTLVKYRIVAHDNAGNCAVEDNSGEYHVYTVIPEFPPFLILPLFMVSTLLAVIVYRKKSM